MQRSWNFGMHGLLCLILSLAISSFATAAPPGGKGGGGGGKNKASLTVSLTAESVSENGGSTTGTVTRENSDLSVPLTVTLSSSPAGEVALLPSPFVIPEGAASKDFTVSAIDDTLNDGDQQVTISASAPDHSGAEAVITVLEDDGLKYSIQWIDNPFDQSIYWADQFSVMDLNESGQFVGRIQERSRTLPNPRLGIFFDGARVLAIEELPAMAALSELGWFASVATGINDDGQIAVAMENSDGTQDVFRYEPATDSTPDSFTRTFSGDWGIAAINNHGDLAFSNYSPAGNIRLYTDEDGLLPALPFQTSSVAGINDSLQVLFETSDPLDPSGPYALAHRYDAVFDSSLTFPSRGVSSINSIGDLLFTYATSVKRNRAEYTPAVYADSTDTIDPIVWESLLHSDMNDNGDLLLFDSVTDKPYLLKSNGEGVLIDTEVQGLATDISKWNNSIVGCQKLNNAGQIAGVAYIIAPDGSTESEDFFILTPIPPGQ